jgi:hypothetical protein
MNKKVNSKFELHKNFLIDYYQLLIPISSDSLATLYKSHIEYINKCYENKIWVYFKVIPDDLVSDYNDFNPELQQYLDYHLTQKFGFGLCDLKNKNFKLIKKIRDKSIIKNEDEYRLVMTRIDEIFMDEHKKEELDDLNNLLVAFEQREKYAK